MHIYMQVNLSEVEVPGWSLAGWLSSLHLERILNQAVRKRFDAYIAEQHAEIDEALLRRYEQVHMRGCLM